MSERVYLFLLGAFILVSLYIESEIMIYGLAVLLVFEGLTNLRLTLLIQKLRGVRLDSGLLTLRTREVVPVDAFRAWRLMVAALVAGSYYLLTVNEYEVLWFFPWFMGFAILGAGASGVCPMMLALRYAGFR